MSKKSMRLEVLEKLVTLATAAFGLVAALAWNDAVQELFKTLFPLQGNLLAKFLYALGVSIVVVAATVYLGHLTEKTENP